MPFNLIEGGRPISRSFSFVTTGGSFSVVVVSVRGVIPAANAEDGFRLFDVTGIGPGCSVICAVGVGVEARAVGYRQQNRYERTNRSFSPLNFHTPLFWSQYGFLLWRELCQQVFTREYPSVL